MKTLDLDNMKELVKKVDFFENMMLKFAEGKMDEANNAFVERHGYDLRKTDNNDHLEFYRWGVYHNTIVLSYREVTPHDCPYGIDLEYKLDDLFINCT